MKNNGETYVWGNRIYYGWFILATSFFLLFIGYGMRHTMGIFLKPILGEFQISRGIVSLAFSINLLGYGFSQPFAGRLTDRFGAKFVIMGSLLLLASSMLLLNVASSLWQVYALYGLMGVGSSGTAFVTHMGFISRWFPSRKATALAIANVGASLGQLAMVPLTMFFILNTGWRTTYLLLAALILLTTIPPTLLVLGRGKPPDSREKTGKPAQIRTRMAEPLTLNHWSEAFRTLPFWQLAGSYFVCGYTVATLVVHLPAFVTDIGFSSTTAARVLAITGGVNVIGILIVGTLADRFGRKRPLAMTYFIRGLSYFFLLYVATISELYVFSVIIGISMLATIPPTSALTGDFFGPGIVSTVFGFITLSHQIGAAVSAFMGGILFDYTGSYQSAFLISGFLLMFATLCSLSIREGKTVQAAPAVATST
jgi:MFS family permease